MTLDWLFDNLFCCCIINFFAAYLAAYPSRVLATQQPRWNLLRKQRMAF